MAYNCVHALVFKIMAEENNNMGERFSFCSADKYRFRFVRAYIKPELNRPPVSTTLPNLIKCGSNVAHCEYADWLYAVGYVSDIQFCLAGETVALAGEKLPWRRAEVFAENLYYSVLLNCGAGMLWCGVEHAYKFVFLAGPQIVLAVVI